MLYGDFIGWVAGAWQDIIVFLIMIAFAVLRWYNVGYYFNSEYLNVSTGFPLKKSLAIPIKKLITVSSQRRFFWLHVKVVCFRADTIGGSAKNSDFSIFLRPEHAEVLMDIIPEHPEIYGYTPGKSAIAVLSLLTSNALGNIILMATFLSGAGKLFGQHISDIFFERMRDFTHAFDLGIPPAALFLAYALILGWAVGFLHMFTRYKNMRVWRDISSLNITAGLFSRHRYCIKHDGVAYIDIRQSVMAYFLKLHALYISATGYDKHKSDISCVIPAEQSQVFFWLLKDLFPEFSFSVNLSAHHKPSGMMRFIALPLCIISAILLVIPTLVVLHPGWRVFIQFTGFMLAVPAVMFLAVQILAFRTGGISCEGGCYIVRYSKLFNLHTVIIPKDSIVMSKITVSPLQKRSGKCDVTFYTRAEKRVPHKCRSVSEEEMKTMFYSER